MPAAMQAAEGFAAVATTTSWTPSLDVSLTRHSTEELISLAPHLEQSLECRSRNEAVRLTRAPSSHASSDNQHEHGYAALAVWKLVSTRSNGDSRCCGSRGSRRSCWPCSLPLPCA